MDQNLIIVSIPTRAQIYDSVYAFDEVQMMAVLVSYGRLEKQIDFRQCARLLIDNCY